ncbi:hypothetical protein [Streptomyces sp. NPDC048106]|uniref:hypothetical protein n=1 Tax=Streptomyces sp. NPDC048106 TaxID=3155750 RepID=UPI0034513D8C
MDRKNAVLGDARGVSLGINGSMIDVPWPFVARIAYQQSVRTRGFALTVAVDTYAGQRYFCAVRTRDGEQIESWIADLENLLERHHPGR